MTQLTSDDGVHHGELSVSGSFVIDRHSAPTQPFNLNVLPVDGRKGTRLLTAEDPWKDYVQPVFECGSIKAADGTTDLFYRMVKPHDFDITTETKNYYKEVFGIDLTDEQANRIFDPSSLASAFN